MLDGQRERQPFQKLLYPLIKRLQIYARQKAQEEKVDAILS